MDCERVNRNGRPLREVAELSYQCRGRGNDGARTKAQKFSLWMGPGLALRPSVIHSEQEAQVEASH